MKPKSLVPLLLVSLLAACASPVDKRNDRDLAAARVGPGVTPQRNVTDFSDGLRCMDEQLFDYGVRDVSIMLEDLQDNTRRLGVGTRDMMVSAFSDMTRRSRAIKVSTFGQDNQNVVNFLLQLQQKSLFGVMPQYDLRGSITQFDEEVVKRDASIGVFLGSLFGLRGGRSAQANVMGFDASMITVPDLTVVPGVSSKNTIVIGREDAGASDGTAQIRKVGITFQMAYTRNDATAQALRNMVELSAIELTGKLLRLPYWKCLKVAADSPEVLRETEDWFVSMRDPADRTRFFQEQLRNRKFFDGALSGKTSSAFESALGAYKRGLGMAEDAPTDLAFFTAFLNRPAPKAPAQPFSTGEPPTPPAGAPGTQAAAGSAAANAPAAPPAPPPPRTGQLSLAASKRQFTPGEAITLSVTSTEPGYLYCYLQNTAGGPIQRFFPNRFVADPRIEANVPLTLPGGQPFKIPAARDARQQTISCLVAPREVYQDLPPPLRWPDFEDIRLRSIGEIQEAFEAAAKAPIARAEQIIDVRK
ncbi:MAG TPA: DUF4384 domain-containing protein [Burkholderiaceae bacterium]|jgi:hypothetical protein|nr:DUF4384 domain-containing protein [Burkholderiaceae bacterium]